MSDEVNLASLMNLAKCLSLQKRDHKPSEVVRWPPERKRGAAVDRPCPAFQDESIGRSSETTTTPKLLGQQLGIVSSAEMVVLCVGGLGARRPTVLHAAGPRTNTVAKPLGSR